MSRPSDAALAEKLKSLIEFSNKKPGTEIDHFHITEAAGECKGGDVIAGVIKALEAQPERLRQKVEAIPRYWVGSGWQAGNSVEANDGMFIKREDVMKVLSEITVAASEGES